MNGCAPFLALIERLKATQKWVIVFQQYEFIFKLADNVNITEKISRLRGVG